jgi:hypothetical protein
MLFGVIFREVCAVQVIHRRLDAYSVWLLEGYYFSRRGAEFEEREEI